MGKPRTIPLARGLVGGEVNSIYGQLEVSLTNYRNIKITIRRKPYSKGSNVSFSIPCTSLKQLLDILHEAHDKLDEIWLSRVATVELKGR